MPFLFSEICRLLSDLEKLKKRHPPLLPTALKGETGSKLEYWFRCQRNAIHAPGVDGVAFLLTLFPERRTDRVYGMKEDRLGKLIGRCLNMNSANRRILEDWKTPGRGDLGDRVEMIQKPYDEPRAQDHPVTVEEVDKALHDLASRVRFSGPDVYKRKSPSSSPDDSLRDIFLRLKSSEAKWLTRLILKDFSPVVLDEYLALNAYHFLLPSLLKFQNSFSAAVGLLRGPFCNTPSFTSDSAAAWGFRCQAAASLTPQIGVKIGRPQFLKARSMENCVHLAKKQIWSVERKYDGEFCEIHIDLQKGLGSEIKIFSKSCKDSTEDRNKLHDTIRTCLGIGQAHCAFKKKCILIGEMVVYSNQEQRILEFHHIRKHIRRSGVPIGNDADSQVRPGEHLMIVLYDLLLIDDDPILRRPYSERREQLTKVMTKRIGHAITADRIEIDFSKPDAKETLCNQFAAALHLRMEGLVLKPLQMPYFSLAGDDNSNQRSYIIKLKKDYLPEFDGERDVQDFAVIGASYDPKLAQKSNIGELEFTTFHLGCMINKKDVARFDQRPVYRVVDAIDLHQCIPPAELRILNECARFQSIPFVREDDRLRDAEDIGFDLVLDRTPSSKIKVILIEPIVVEVLGSSYEKPSNKAYYMLRHPRILKVHLDRSWKETVSFDELQEEADKALKLPQDESTESKKMSQNVKDVLGRFRSQSEQDRVQRSTSRLKATAIPATTVRTTQSSHSDSPCVRRQQGSSNLRDQPHVLVRVDTAELCLGEVQTTDPALKLSGSDLKVASGSLPKPKSSAVASISKSGNLKRPKSHRKRASDEILEPRPTKTIVLGTRTPPRGQRTLTDITNDKSTRIVNRSPPAFPIVRATGERKAVIPKIASKRPSITCSWPDCPFANAVVYLSPCIRGQSWVADDLLTCHGTERATDLEHWLRDNAKQPSLGSVIAESAAWPSMQKIVLVESRREEATRALVEEIRKVGLRDEVIFFDWRFLEEWNKFESGMERFCPQKFLAVAKRYLYGRTIWEDGREEVSFLDKDSASIPRDWIMQ
ncbi:hypothetical protein BLS_005608 [Venturia inaequalis]|uniref:ATP-dependent DNA ligase family profile domain-containing protein n=1 Tax=Venturia inaequalis TaxID=5025 RepID=A0A8H3YPT6_VENIN|nr:hypothetical protein BLS_005608 [Venturia inaequalis]